MKPVNDERFYAMLYRLAGNTDFQSFCGWLSDSLMEAGKAERRIKDDVQLRWSQGGSQCLEDILTVIAESKKNLDAIQNAKK